MSRRAYRGSKPQQHGAATAAQVHNPVTDNGIQLLDQPLRDRLKHVNADPVVGVCGPVEYRRHPLLLVHLAHDSTPLTDRHHPSAQNGKKCCVVVAHQRPG